MQVINVSMIIYQAYFNIIFTFFNDLRIIRSIFATVILSSSRKYLLYSSFDNIFGISNHSLLYYFQPWAKRWKLSNKAVSQDAILQYRKYECVFERAIKYIHNNRLHKMKIGYCLNILKLNSNRQFYLHS